MKKYDLNNLTEFGRIAFAMGLSDVGYSRLPKDKQAIIASGWHNEYMRNKVRLLKRYENKEVPDNLLYADQPCINKRYVDQQKFIEKAENYGY